MSFTDGFNDIEADFFDSGSPLAPSAGANTASTPGFGSTPFLALNAGTNAGAANAALFQFPSSGAASTASTFTGSSADLTGISSAGAVGTQGSVGSIGGAGGIAVNLTDETQLAPDVTAAGKAVQSGANTVGSNVTSSASNIANTAASAISSLEQYTSATFVAIAISVMGIIFVAYGLGLFGKKRVQQIVQSIPAPVKAAAVLWWYDVWPQGIGSAKLSRTEYEWCWRGCYDDYRWNYRSGYCNCASR
jgi:hypothetical protein